MNWIDFLTDNFIEYVTRGQNTKRGEVSVKCPWCDEDDPSMHLGISLTAENWGCLRNPAHRGHNAPRLIAAILGCSHTQAILIAAQYSRHDPETLEAALAALTLTSEAPEHAEGLIEAVPHFRAIKPIGSTARFWQYLTYRGFLNVDLPALIDQYRLKCVVAGRFKDRIIIPFFKDKKLIAWTGRAITDPKRAPRYLSSDLVKTTLFNYDALQAGGKVLFVVEGPFDALKLDFYGQTYGARTTCILGVSMSNDQIMLLNILRFNFEKVVVLFDRDALEPAFSAIDWLHSSNVTLGQLPDGVKDPGELSGSQIEGYIKQVI
jgi:hypothetical protein